MRHTGWVAGALLTAAVGLASASDEIYIANTGTGVLVLRQDDQGLTVPLCTVYPNMLLNQRFVAKRSDDVLTVTVQEHQWGWRAGEYKDHVAYVMRRSATPPGDYDLVARHDIWLAVNNPALLAPYHSFLHRLDDPRLVAYYLAASDRADAAITTQTTRLGKEIAGEHADDSHARLVYWDSLMRTSDAPELEHELNVHRDQYVSASLPLKVRYAQAIDTLRSLRSSQSGRNSWDVVTQWRQRRLDLAALMQRSTDFVRKPDFIPRQRGFTGGVGFLDLQVLAKVLRIQSTLLLFRGEFQQSRDVLLSAYRLGQMQAPQFVLVESLIGTAIRTISSAGLDLYAQNACHSPDDLKKLMDGLDWMERNPPKSWSTTDSLNWTKDDLARDHLDGKKSRESVADAKYGLMKTAVAARHMLLANSTYPSGSNFGPLLPNGPPKDPFVDGPLRYIPEYGRDPFTLYSIGPDGRDSRGAIEYDPTNGTVSSGDITLAVPRTPKYPFPQQPLRTRSEAVIRRQFPNGLPADVFADKRGYGLSIAPTQPIRIFSFGPDTNQAEAQGSHQPYLPLIPYDPTNGAVSRGDLYVDILE